MTPSPHPAEAQEREEFSRRLSEFAIAVRHEQPARITAIHDILLSMLDAARASHAPAAAITEPATQPQGDSTNRDALVQLIADKLSGTYHCIRVWEAWSVGTMSEDDFEDVGESDTPGELADEILAALASSNAAAGQLAQALEAAKNGLQWYRDAYPDADSGADDEMHAQIDAALQAHNK